MMNELATSAYANQTTMHPLGLAAVVVLGFFLLVLPRRWAVLPIAVMACFIASAQRIVVFTLDFDLIRVMVLIGWIRLLCMGEARGFQWKSIDWVMLAWATSGTIANGLQYGTLDALISALGTAFDAVGMYFLFRCLIRTWDDVDRIVLGFIVISVFVAAAFAIERVTGRNAFSVFGGVPALTMSRDGRLRCQGAFSHPILAGCFWASLIPLFACRWKASRRDRVWAIVGMGTSSLIVFLSGSSTPVMGVLFALLGMAMFPVRFYMRWVRWGLVAAIVSLHLVMKAPVWHLIARIDIFSGNTGWHRYHLIDQAIRRFGEWWLLGTRSTEHWDEWGLLWDVTNQYVLEGVRGGALTLALFFAVIVLAFRGVGRTWTAVNQDRAKLTLAWALGVSLFVHCTNFIAVSYFGQITMLWYLLLAMIGSLTPRKALQAGAIRRSRCATAIHRRSTCRAPLGQQPLGHVTL